MKNLPATPWVVGLLQAAGVAMTVALSIALSFSAFQFIEIDPVGILILFCTFALVDLLIVLAYPLQLISVGQAKDAFAVLRWTLLFLVIGTIVWIGVVGPFVMPQFGIID